MSLSLILHMHLLDTWVFHWYYIYTCLIHESFTGITYAPAWYMILSLVLHMHLLDTHSLNNVSKPDQTTKIHMIPNIFTVLIRLLIHSLVRSFVRSPVHAFIHSFIHSLIQWIVCSFHTLLLHYFLHCGSMWYFFQTSIAIYFYLKTNLIHQQQDIVLREKDTQDRIQDHYV